MASNIAASTKNRKFLPILAPSAALRSSPSLTHRVTKALGFGEKNFRVSIICPDKSLFFQLRYWHCSCGLADLKPPLPDVALSQTV